MPIPSRLKFASRAAASHLLACIAVAIAASILVFGVWYPDPYQKMAGGRGLFFLIVGVDIVSGPLLTLALFTPIKRRTELVVTLVFISAFQLMALGYGLFTVWRAHPLFMVSEVDRFKIISAADLRESDLALLPQALKPGFFDGPKLVATRAPSDPKERQQIMDEAMHGGPDVGERPKYYVAYDASAAGAMLARAKPMEKFLQKYPDQKDGAETLAGKAGLKLDRVRYLPVIAREEWIALLDEKGAVIGFLKGDGF